jgi:hypothetical protein
MIGPVIVRWLSVKSILVTGQLAMTVSLIFVVVFQLANVPVMVLVSMICMIILFQSSMGSYFFVYVGQVAIE